MTTTTTVKSACCGGQADPTICGCGKATCEACGGKGLERPRFFAGQLLTEEDLALLTHYVADKSRLHNRHLFGEGVVCGLDVKRHPCDRDTIVVDPGYALDCCGNDIVAGCPVSLDVPKLIRELRARKTGFDCGPPCDDQNKQGQSERYCLYVRYCETDTDPVLAYGQDECSGSACEPTRTREGYRFELECFEPPVPPEDLSTRFCACFEELDSEALEVVGRERDQWRMILAGEDPVFDEELGRELTALVVPLTQPLEALSANGVVRAPYEWLRAFSLLALHQVTGSDQVKNVVSEVSELVSRRAKEVVEANAAGRPLGIVALALAEGAKRHGWVLAARRRTGAEDGPELREEARLVSAGAPAAVLAPASLARELEVSRGALLAQLSGLGKTGTLTRTLATVQVVEFAQADPVARIKNLYEVGRAQGRALDAIERACLCDALHPPCPPCEDPKVLLACFVFDYSKCEVRELCSLVRTFVLSPRAVRYWLPWISDVEQELREACCSDRETEYAQERLAGLEEARGVQSGRTLAARRGHLSLSPAKLIDELRSRCEPRSGRAEAQLRPPMSDDDCQAQISRLERELEALKVKLAELAAQGGNP